jgi:hypothetical protein
VRIFQITLSATVAKAAGHKKIVEFSFLLDIVLILWPVDIFAQIINNRTDCLNENLTWTNSKINFDNVGQGYLALFQVVRICCGRTHPEHV